MIYGLIKETNYSPHLWGDLNVYQKLGEMNFPLFLTGSTVSRRMELDITAQRHLLTGLLSLIKTYLKSPHFHFI